MNFLDFIFNLFFRDIGSYAINIVQHLSSDLNEIQNVYSSSHDELLYIILMVTVT